MLSRLKFILLAICMLAQGSALLAQFTSAVAYGNLGGTIFQRVQVADLDNDGDQDIITRERFGGSTFWVKNDGHGNFSNQMFLPQSNPSSDLTSIQAIDYDRDGDQDIVSSYDGGKILLWTNIGGGSFNGPLTMSNASESVVSLAIQDIDGDNDLDIAVATQYTDSYYFENSSGSWTKKPLGIEQANYLSFVKSGSTLNIFSVSSYFSKTRKNGVDIGNNTITNANYVKATDIDRDGDTDVIAGNFNYDKGIIFYENINGSYLQHVIENSAGAWYYSLVVFDYDGDGDEDIFAGCWLDCGVSMFENNGAGNFTLTKNVSYGAMLEQEMVAADMNGDGRIDLIHNNTAVHQILWDANGKLQFQGIEASFISSGICASVNVQFKSTSRGKNITSWEWDFGDGSTSTARAPSHQYPAAGTYSVTLTVRNGTGLSHTVQQSVTTSQVTKADDRVFGFCTTSAVLSLDPSFDYKWYGSETSLDVLFTGAQQSFFATATYYFTRTDLQTGCTSARTKVLVQKWDFPNNPTTTDAFTYQGSAEMILKADGGSNTIAWTNVDGQLLATGPYYTAKFDATTTVYATAVNPVNCVSDRIPVVANVYDGPVPAPVVIWGDATQSNSWSEGIDLTKDNDGNYIAYGLWSQDQYKAGNFTLEGNGLQPHFLTWYTDDGTVLKSLKVLSGTYTYFQNNRITVDANNDLYVSFGFQNSFDFMGHTIDPASQFLTYTFVGKISKDGNYLWHTVLPNNKVSLVLFPDGTPAVVQTNSSFPSVIVTLLSASTGIVSSQFFPTQTGISWGVTTDANANLYIGGGNTVAKFTQAGMLLWQKDFVQYGSQGGNGPQISKLTIDKDMNLIVTGSYGTDRYAYPPPPPATVMGVPLGTGFINYFTKLDPSGNLIWIKRFNSPIGKINDLASDHTGDIFMVYQASGAARITKFNQSGNLLWKREYGVMDMFAIEPDEAGNAMVLGSFRDAASLDGVSLISRKNSTVFVNYNFMIAKLGFVKKADFIFQRACVGQNTIFTDMSTPAPGTHIVAWAWDFGNGATSSAQHPTYQYNVAGVYTVKLRTTDNLGGFAFNQYSVAAEALTKPVIQTSDNDLCTGNEVQLSLSGTYPLYKWSTNATTPKLPVNVAGNYTVTVGSTQLCWSPVSQPIAIQFHDRATAPVINAAALTACANTSITLSLNKTYSAVSWSNGATTQQALITQPGTFTVRAGESFNCLSTASLPVTLSFTALPIASISLSAGVLTSTPGLSYKWFKDNVVVAPATAQTYTPFESGVYTVEVMGPAGCKKLSAPVPVQIATPPGGINTGVEDQSMFSVWPNPVHDVLFFSGSSQVRITLLDITGQTCFTRDDFSGSLDLSEFSSGIYVLKVSQKNGELKVVRIVKY